jgi:uncharacterized membrane protein YphA (DoxX/SURF4 family)
MLMHDFNFGRPPAWSDNLARTMWSYVGGVVVTIAGIAVITRRYATQATLIAGLIILLSIFLIRNIPDLFSKDLSSAFWSLNAFKTLALAGGCFVVSVSLRKEGDRFSKILLWFGAISLAYFLFLCGIAHFKFIGFITGGFIPTYIPFQNFWTYLTGTCLILGGAGLLVKPVRRLAALMSGIMILGWFFLLHIPRVLAAPSDYLEWFGVFESFGFVGILFVLSSLFYKSEVVSVPRQL